MRGITRIKIGAIPLLLGGVRGGHAKLIGILLMLKMYTLDKFPKLQLDTIVSKLKIVKKCIHFFMPISEETFFN